MTKAHPHRQVNVHLDTVDDADVIERIEAQPSMVGYVRELVRRDIHGERLQAIAATLGPCNCSNSERTGTCHNVHEPPKDETFWPVPHFKCSGCGATHVSMEYVFYCPNCGRKVVDE